MIISLLSNIAAGGTIVAILIELMQVFCVAIGLVLWGVLGLITGGIAGDNSSVWSVKDVLFNRSSATTASFFYSDRFNMGLTMDGIQYSEGIVPKIFEQVSKFYYIMRNISIAALLLILLYIGIRMAISTVASDEAKYKKMLGNWAVSMALVFVLHFIIIATLYVNNKLVGVLYEFSGEVDGWDYAAIAAEGLVPVVGIGEAITFALMLGMEFNFVLIYIKRVITLAFLIVIAPLITITYSIDKIKDNRSQALDTWLKEYMFTVLIQPFHCIIYIVIIQTALKGMSSINIGTDIIYIIMLKFMKDAEEIVRKIFGIRSDSLPGFKASGAMALGVMSKLGSSAGKGGGKSGGGSGKESKVPNFKKEQKSADAAANAAQRGANARNPQIPGQGGNNGGPQGGNNQPPAPQPQPQDQNNQPSRMERVINSGRDIANKVGDTEYGKQLKGIVNRRGGVKNIIQSGAKHGAQLAGFGFGLGLTGEIDQAAGFSMLAGNTTESIEGAIDNYYDNKKLDSNEEVIKNDLVQLIDDKNVGDDPVERQKAFDVFIDKFDKWSKGDLQLSAFDPAERTLIEDRLEPQIKGWAKRGESDPDALMKGLIEKTAKEDKKRHRN